MDDANDRAGRERYRRAMSKRPNPNDATKQPSRPHHIAEWAALHNMRAVDLAEAVDADKSVVSRWLNGGSPTRRYQEKLADLFGCSREALFRHPDEEWFVQFLDGRPSEEIGRIKNTLKSAFPKPN